MTQPTAKTLLETKRFRVEQVERQRENGKTERREVIRHPGAAVIVPLLADGRVCLTRNFRLSVNRTLIEAPAGTLEPGEPPHETALRELAEETGFRAGKIELLLTMIMSPGILDERSFVYVATDLTEGKPDLQGDEQIENLIVTWDEALGLIDRGEIEDAKTIAALLACDRRRRRG